MTNAGDSPSSGRSSICSIPGSPVSHRSGRALRKEGQRDLHSSSFSVSSKLLIFHFRTILQTLDCVKSYITAVVIEVLKGEAMLSKQNALLIVNSPKNQFLKCDIALRVHTI